MSELLQQNADALFVSLAEVSIVHHLLTKLHLLKK